MNKYLAILYSVMVRSRREEAVKGSRRVASAGGRRWVPAGGRRREMPVHITGNLNISDWHRNAAGVKIVTPRSRR